MSDPISTTALTGTTCRLASWILIRVSGVDARAFLHGQLSNDLTGLASNAAQWTAYCSPKGRMLAGFLAWVDADQAIWLACDRGIAAGLLKRLRMFVLRAKVLIEDVGTDWQIEGVIGGASPAPFQVDQANGATRVGLPPVEDLSRHLDLFPADNLRPADNAPAAEETAWRLAMIRAGESWITSATQDQFVPQMVNFDTLGGINFKKGCYPGQEVVARAHYRGAVKRRMVRATVATGGSTAQPVPCEPGQPLFTAGESAQECGQVVNMVRHDDGSLELLAVVSTQSRNESPIHLGGALGPVLDFAALPYEISAAEISSAA